ncbi:MAG: ammonium transporter [Oscillospiraceae bacterium]|nr:ammonium transporter [Oscillospiraceae bacterium]
MSGADTGFMLICAALVMLMTPALGFFYGGLGRRKNVVNNLFTSYVCLGIGAVMWFIMGYSLCFGGDGKLFGDFSKAFLNGITPNTPFSDEGSTYSELVWVGFQMTFAMITTALLTGAVAGRMKFKSLFIFLIVWSVVVYYPLAHMVWGGGLLGLGFGNLGSIDFAGGNVVHISSGITALVLCIILGKRKGYEKGGYKVHNIPFVALGAGVLWFGWYGFNAGSSGLADGLAAHAFMTTSIAAGAAMLSWMLIDVIKTGKATLVGASTGLVIGLVAITPGAGFVPLWAALIIGILVSPISFFMISVIKKKIGYDDALDVFGCHGAGGIWGGIATGLFANPEISGWEHGYGLFYNKSVEYVGDEGTVTYNAATQFLAQLGSIGFTIMWAVVGAVICYFVCRLLGPIKATEREQAIGMDKSEHDEEAYPSFNGLD